MIQYIWLIAIILYGSLKAKPEDKIDAILWCGAILQSNAPEFSAGFRFPSLDQVSSAHTRSEQSRNNFIEKSHLWAQQAQERMLIEQVCMKASFIEIADFFEQCRSQGIFADSQLLTWYSLYRSSSYRAYVKGLPGYEHHVIQLHRKLSKDKKTRKKTAKQMDLTLESAQKLVDHLWNELQHDRTARATQKQAQQAELAAAHAKQQQWQTIKSAQQHVLQSQTPLLEQCTTQWKIQAQDSTNDISMRYMRRIHMANSDHWREHTYQINTHVSEILTQQNITPDHYMHLYGNELQHTLHSEFLSILDQVALNNQQGISDKFIKKLNQCTVECTDIGCVYNKEGASAYASMMADAGWTMLDLASAVAEALRDVTINTADLVMHPLQTLCAINRGIFYFVVSTGDGLLYKDTDYQYVPESRASVIAAYDAIGRELLGTAHQMRTRDWIKGITYFAAECVLQAKLLKTLSCACKNAGKYALRCAQIIEASIPEAKVAIAGMEGITTEIVALGETVAHTAAQEEKLFNLIKQADGTYRSSVGLIYGKDKIFGNRVYHVLEHTKEVIKKTTHTMFTVTNEELFALIDEAWLKRGLPLPDDLGVYIVDMGKIIGTAEETAIRIVTRPGTSTLLTAYPVKV